MAKPAKHPPLWRRDIPDDERLTIINPEDFPKEEILKSLGLSRFGFSQSFGIIDQDEIRNRQGLCSIMLRDPEFRSWVQASHGIGSGLPIQGQEFLSYNDPLFRHTSYWQLVYDFLARMESLGVIPLRLQSRVEEIRSGLPLEQRERDMAAEITRRLENVTVLEGLMQFQVGTMRPYRLRSQDSSPVYYSVDELKPTDVQIYGHTEFSQQLTRAQTHDLPMHAYDWFNPFGWPARLYQAYLDWVVIRRVFRSMVITKADPGLIDDVRDGVRQLLNYVTWNDRDFEESRVTVYCFYGHDGLQIQVLDVDSPRRKAEPEAQFSIAARFEGYTRKQADAIRRARRRYAGAMEDIRQSLASHNWRAYLEKALPGLFTKRHRAYSRRTDDRYRWFAISNLYRTPRWRTLYDQLMEHRANLKDLLEQLSGVAALVQHLQDQADKFGVPLTAPEIVEGDHVVAFEGLFPTQLLFRMEPEEVVPLNGIPELNGSFIGLTGKHGGGKTETLVTIAANLFLAQSGLPVFGLRFRSNVKTVLAMAFIPQRGVGSTIEQMTGKIRRILEAIQDVPGREVIVLLDEVGTGTQTSSGIKFGQDLLTKLQSLGCSVIYSSQFHEIAKFASSRLGAQNFQFDRQHRIQPGIGDGGLEEHLEETGLTELLKVT